MSGLVQLRQRIKAVQTIKKITHAMRIVSMSTHSRLRNRQQALKEYKETLFDLYTRVSESGSTSSNNKLDLAGNKSGKTLVIIVGSQKGLCGNFNNNLFAYVQKRLDKTASKIDIISVGKKTHDYLLFNNYEPLQTYDEFTTTHLSGITNALVTYILDHLDHYAEVHLYSMAPRTFFSQKSGITQIIPFAKPKAAVSQDEVIYHWEEPAPEILEYCTQELLATTVYEALLLSLVAEQAARFVAMDNSTRNASNLLDAMNLRYNKTRQSKITRELTDLIGGFE